MQRALLAAITMASAMAISAQNYLHIQTDSGWKLLDLDKVERISFAGGVMTATDASNNVLSSIAQSNLKMMYVDEVEDLSGVQLSTITQTESTMAYDASTKTLHILADGTLDVYNAAGLKLISIPEVKKGEDVNVEQLATAGTVIFKNGNYIIKTVVK